MSNLKPCKCGKTPTELDITEAENSYLKGTCDKCGIYSVGAKANLSPDSREARDIINNVWNNLH